MKKNIITILTVFLTALGTVHAEELTFPQIGATYLLTYSNKPADGTELPSEVKIVAKGEGQWFQVEYQRTFYRGLVRKRILTPNPAQSPQPITEPTQVPQPTPQPSPVVTTERKWLNFALILAADEKQ